VWDCGAPSRPSQTSTGPLRVHEALPSRTQHGGLTSRSLTTPNTKLTGRPRKPWQHSLPPNTTKTYKQTDRQRDQERGRPKDIQTDRMHNQTKTHHAPPLKILAPPAVCTKETTFQARRANQRGKQASHPVAMPNPTRSQNETRSKPEEPTKRES
jgi:hypothetical protein